LPAGRVCQGCGAKLVPNKGPGPQRKWCSDRCRKNTLYVRFCADCGARLNSSDGHGPHAPVRCPGCASRASGEARKVWTPDAVVAAIQAWARLHGEPPCMTTWSITRARNIGKPELTQVKLVPYKAGEWPSPQAVIRAFGSWNAGIEAAGFTPRLAQHAQPKAAA
jgi:DNA-directed RNA polymerase subunit RPC12/RpoP